MLFTPDERRAILAIAGLLLLGLGIRLLRPGGPPPEGGGDSLLVAIAQQSETPSRAPGIDPDGRLRINTADEGELMGLPGIGPALARRIREARAEGGPFVSAEDLQRVKGIGPKLASRIAPMVSYGVDSCARRAAAAGGDSSAIVESNGELRSASPDSGRRKAGSAKP